MATEPESVRVHFEIVESARLRPHEEVEEPRVALVIAALRKLSEVRDPVIADAVTGVILDGHHRWHALRRMGYLRVPVAFVDYHDPRIRVASWRASETPPTKDEVLAMALSGRQYPPKTTRHVFPAPVGEFRVRLDDLR